MSLFLIAAKSKKFIADQTRDQRNTNRAEDMDFRIRNDLRRVQEAVNKRRSTFQELTGQKEEDVDFPEDLRDDLDAAEQRLLEWKHQTTWQPE